MGWCLYSLLCEYCPTHNINIWVDVYTAPFVNTARLITSLYVLLLFILPLCEYRSTHNMTILVVVYTAPFVNTAPLITWIYGLLFILPLCEYCPTHIIIRLVVYTIILVNTEPLNMLLCDFNAKQLAPEECLLNISVCDTVLVNVKVWNVWSFLQVYIYSQYLQIWKQNGFVYK